MTFVWPNLSPVFGHFLSFEHVTEKVINLRFFLALMSVSPKEQETKKNQMEMKCNKT
jgi:hypothetical protein